MSGGALAGAAMTLKSVFSQSSDVAASAASKQVTPRSPQKPKPMRERVPPVSIRVTAEERAQLQKAADGQSMNGYLRSRIFGPAASPEPRMRGKAPVKDYEALARVLAALGRSGIPDALSRLTAMQERRRMGSQGAADIALERACADIAIMRAELIRALGLQAKAAQSHRRKQEEQARQSRIRTGLRGLLDRMTGQRRKVEEQNRQEAAQSRKRDYSEREAQQQKAIHAQTEAARRAAFKEQRRKADIEELQQNRRILSDAYDEASTQDRATRRDRFKKERQRNRSMRRRSRMHNAPEP